MKEFFFLFFYILYSFLVIKFVTIPFSMYCLINYFM
nr:MAG TPA: hypothetical protein [Caudoviricetes sp.]